MVAANDKVAVGFMLSSGEVGDAPKGRELLEKLGYTEQTIALLMDRAYEGNETRALAISLGYSPVVPPKKNRVDPWEYDKELYKKRNEVERFFCFVSDCPDTTSPYYFFKMFFFTYLFRLAT